MLVADPDTVWPFTHTRTLHPSQVRKTADRIRKTYGAETVHYLEVGVEIPKEEWTVTSRS